MRQSSPLARIVEVERTEVAGLAWSFAYFFAVLCGYYVIRPVRDEMSVTVGSAGLQRLFLIVLLVMIAAVPLFGWVVSTFQRRRVVPIAYGFFVLDLLLFWLLFQGGAPGALLAGAFFVWVSVFNLFAVSLFWSVMADLWTSEQAKRLYGCIAAGGSAGALAGPLFTQSLVKAIGTANLLLVSALLLALATFAAVRLRGLLTGRASASDEARPLGKGLLTGAIAVWRSPYLFRIALWILLANLVGTLFYLEQTRIVGASLSDPATRVQLFARIDLAVSLLTILAQLLLTARALRYLGVGGTAAILPASALVSLGALALAPTLGVIVTIMAAERAIAFSLANPAVKVLYTVVAPEDKYKAQNFNDTVVFRAGDAASGGVYNALAGGLGLSVAGLTAAFAPIALVWLTLALALGRQQTRRADIGHALANGGRSRRRL